ncbi:MAG: 3-phosphoshikimate 1-carboxyvinyltransferase [Candidatus Eremiobacteraeota bacterium]|nr:3-phosphoshikimate 1-carboxyvinyltransferase [Candidatus Eremiobacteraeota bacterium]
MLGRPNFVAGPLHGEVAVPGDKSISHRALIAGAAARRPISISNLNPGRDVRATLEALRALGVPIVGSAPNVTVASQGLRPAAAPLDCMNSGSTARMLLGACAGANVPAAFDGDESLRRRPMEPVAAQLRAFGARIETTQGRLPMAFSGTSAIETRKFILLAPSAQVKSALLFAGAFAGVEIGISGDRGSRDHTERLLRALGYDVEWDGRTVVFRPGAARSETVSVPGDFSAAAFFITAATIAPGSRIRVRDVGLNPTRTGLLDALRHMGARFDVSSVREVCGEPVGDVRVEHAQLRGASIGADLALRALDEIPLLAVAAAFARGETRIEGVGALRSKESDRIAGVGRLLDAVGIDFDVRLTGVSIFGGTPVARDIVVETHDDHRIAMAAAVLACGAGPISIDSDASLDVSFPAFARTLEACRPG